MSLNASIFPIVTLVPSSYDDNFSGYLLHAAAFTPSEFCFLIIALYTYLLANNLVWEEKNEFIYIKIIPVFDRNCKHFFAIISNAYKL